MTAHETARRTLSIPGAVRIWILALACALLLGVPAGSGTASADEAKSSQPAWCKHAPDNDCRPASCASGKRIIVLFTADWCGWCRHLKNNVLPDPDVGKLLGNFFLMEVDADKNEDFVKEAGVSRFPSWIIIEKKCEKGIDAFSGTPRTPGAFIKRFTPYLAH